MKLNYEYTEKDYKRFLIRSRKINNIILFVVGLAVYLYLTLNKTPLWYLPIFIVILILYFKGDYNYENRKKDELVMYLLS